MSKCVRSMCSSAEILKHFFTPFLKNGTHPKKLSRHKRKEMWFHHSQDSAGSSHHPSSYAPDSQCSDFSQINTQDLFSQNSSGPQNEILSQKRMTMYEKWLNKKSLLKSQLDKEGKGSNTSTAGSTNNSNKCYSVIESRTSLGGTVSETAGLNRDLLQQIKNSFQDSSKEIRNALGAFKKKLDTNTELSQEQLSQTLSTFLQDVWKHQEQICNMLCEHVKKASSSEELHTKIAVNEKQITLLEEQLLAFQQSGAEKLSKEVENVLSSHLSNLDQKLEDLIKYMKQTKEKQEFQSEDYKNCLEKNIKECMNQYGNRNSQMKEIDKKIMTEVADVKEKMEMKLCDLRTKLIEEFQVLFKRQTKDISDTHKQLFKQLNQNIFPLKNLRSQNNTVIMEHLDTLGTKLEKVVQKCFSSNDWNIPTIQNSITESLHVMLSSLLKQTNNDCISDILQQVEERLLSHISTMLKHDNKNNLCNDKSLSEIDQPQKRCEQKNSSLNNVDVQLKKTQRSDRYHKRSSKCKQDTGINNNVMYNTRRQHEKHVIDSERQKESVLIDNSFTYGKPKYQTKNNGICEAENNINKLLTPYMYCSPNFSPSQRMNLNLSKVQTIDKVKNPDGKSNGRKRKYCENENQQTNFFNRDMQLHFEPAQLSRYSEDKSDFQAYYKEKKGKYQHLQSPFQTSFKAVEKVYKTRQMVETQSHHEFWSQNLENNSSVCQQKALLYSDTYGDCYADRKSILNKLSSRKFQSSLSSHNGYNGENGDEINSCDSSPTVSLANVTIKKQKAPYKTRLIQDSQTVVKEIKMDAKVLSPAPTLLSEIDL
ncbi:uncharacterized protein LOC106077905 isoform X2 [Biomphalaria glabrata]|uniref:Uncharacterized protein LOC106077905 isoform X2 n=1 Tax=Biomphalaria glabrata TaxID=6526 RepID=A0A9W3A9N4_BIOGL|nr:uncharacterized protein LOC106077905 isoform X2 [Biomphalaria glabrata]